MIRHVVLWKLKAADQEAKARDFSIIRNALASQLGRIPGLSSMEVGLNEVNGRRAVDFALICQFDDREALAAYHRHPAHSEVRSIVDPLVSDHWIVDYTA